ncbi:NADH:flavin oxidoreductase/NADH oxidase family protein [Talaromyces proteolyticus]|uniref:NADH:flavin oxidoreductase/NADH oxidase family protein n=1 Tax=Talaromyces proteolyticus TaxID=1131652 RepID=A0AAD4Q2Z2_9EURO|nr:NADH:flavin oxidoreductase/NADH oxidase family protein [Talaromyces proteolyticus]KAH8700881.1 NADH:flavin oxidoreductase/NADH oxidase family protein [Talaromyces proteolyticus]
MSTLFSPLKLGRHELAHRTALAPLTRFRADDNHVPLPFVKEYYAQRGSVPGTLLITEATIITPQAGLYPNVPGIYTPAQISAWREITDAVHARGSLIYLQLWALGRTASLDTLKAEGVQDHLVSSSATPLEGAPVPTPLTEEGIQAYIRDFALAAKRAVDEAGFDGVEVHGANGYLIDQFIQDVVNKRTDGWGGSVEKRGRFALEVTKAVAEAVGADRTAIRLSPYNTYQEMGMADPVPQFTYIVGELAKLGLAYLHVVGPRVTGSTTIETTKDIDWLLKAYGNASPVVLCGGFSDKTAVEAAEKYKGEGFDVVVAFGRWFISNPDLPFRLKEGIEFAPYDRSTFYQPKVVEGYTDYKFSERFALKAAA